MSAEGGGNKVRRIAILVTSLDASAGRQLLMAMPTELARQVRRAMTQLGHIDPEEQRQILAEFRMQAMLSAESHSPSLGSHPTSSEPQGANPGSRPQTSEPQGSPSLGSASPDARTTPQFLTTAAAESIGTQPGAAPGLSGVNFRALGELLRGERATVVAVVINQLDPRQAAELLGKLPKPLQREVIVSLPRLGQIDPDAMTAIHEHLASRIADYHHRQAGESESTSRMQELLAAAAPELRSDWQSTLLQAEPHLASRMGIAQPQSLVPAQVGESLRDSRESRRDSPTRAYNPLEMLANNVVTTADLHMAKNPATTVEKTIDQSVAQLNAQADEPDDARARILPFPVKATVADSQPSLRFEQILDLPAEEIGQILAEADTDVILYALAGASPLFMKRFMAMLDRADGRALQARLKQLRSINLKDVDAAQRQLCELANRRQYSKSAA